MATDAPTVVAASGEGHFSFAPVGRRRRAFARLAGESAMQWAPKWRRLVAGPCGAGAGPPCDFVEFDRVVRGMLNRISTENARFLLPLDPDLRGADAGDCAPWWATRCAALMLNHYIQVIHTSRCARGLAMRSNDNVLPEYLDAVAPLLARSPQLVKALVAWVARLLHWHDLCWPVTRLLHLAAHDPRDRSALPPHSLGRLPPELVTGRILGFLVPPTLPEAASDQEVGVPAALCACWSNPAGKKDVVAVLAHLLLFTPAAAFPQLSACALAMAEATLQSKSSAEEEKVYLAAAVVVAVAQRIETSLVAGPFRRTSQADTAASELAPPPAQLAMSELRQELACIQRLEGLLVVAAHQARTSSKLSAFVDSRVLAATKQARQVSDLAASADCLVA
eukprot:gb/GFBE01058325.1/.p1 GENE.gb/GFBE01058325.1/~~gb/GFBE01058325.1/.p1  ORF type:complete len:394 (+),score=50.96 gb/GFBE01058325.1/:1-1182(+)